MYNWTGSFREIDWLDLGLEIDVAELRNEHV